MQIITQENQKELKETSSDNIDNEESTIEIDEELEMMQDNKNKTSIEEVLKAMQLDLEKQKYAEAVYYFKSNLVVLLIAIIGATPLCKKITQNIRQNKIGTLILEVLEPMVLIGLMLLVTAYLVDGSFNPFLYFRF